MQYFIPISENQSAMDYEGSKFFIYGNDFASLHRLITQYFSLRLNFQYEVFIFFDRLCAKSSEMLPLFSSTQHCTRLWPSARHQARDEDEQGEKSHFRVPSVNSLFTPKDKRFPLRAAC